MYSRSIVFICVFICIYIYIVEPKQLATQENQWLLIVKPFLGLFLDEYSILTFGVVSKDANCFWLGFGANCLGLTINGKAGKVKTLTKRRLQSASGKSLSY